MKKRIDETPHLAHCCYYAGCYVNSFISGAHHIPNCRSGPCNPTLLVYVCCGHRPLQVWTKSAALTRGAAVLFTLLAVAA